MKLQKNERGMFVIDLNHWPLEATLQQHFEEIVPPQNLFVKISEWNLRFIRRWWFPKIFLVIGYIITSTLIDPLSLSLRIYQPYMFCLNFNNADLWKEINMDPSKRLLKGNAAGQNQDFQKSFPRTSEPVCILGLPDDALLQVQTPSQTDIW